MGGIPAGAGDPVFLVGMDGFFRDSLGLSIERHEVNSMYMYIFVRVM